MCCSGLLDSRNESSMEDALKLTKLEYHKYHQFGIRVAGTGRYSGALVTWFRPTNKRVLEKPFVTLETQQLFSS